MEVWRQEALLELQIFILQQKTQWAGFQVCKYCFHIEVHRYINLSFDHHFLSETMT